jgi:2,4-dienoyl-CoA reductase-like NADH-dependent reductase (Old Yellow Enzyme family)/thioredoxin reductase
MATGTGTEDGYVTEETLDYYEARSKGGVGLIIVESSCIDLILGRHAARPVAVDHDKFVPGLAKLAKAIQKHGARAAIQLTHPGGGIKHALIGQQPVGPSAIQGPGGDIPRALSAIEIEDIVNKFTLAAKRSRDAGFDGVEIHAAHTYLGAQFLSSAWNARKDQYGGSLEHRARFLVEILQSIREAVGKSYPLWCRMNAEETGLKDGTTLEESRALARMIEESGADAINVSGAVANFRSGLPYFFPHGHMAHLAAGIKHAVHVPVMAVGRISPDLGEQLLKDKKSDFIVMGRALRADAELPNKLASGRLEDIRPCIACNDCYAVSRPGGKRLCAVNAEIGREREYRIVKVKKKKKVLVVGGGPAGLEAARVASLRGHEVTICEKGGSLGGKLLLAAIAPFKSDIEALKDYLIRQIGRQGIPFKLHTEVTPSIVRSMNPDVVIVATGAIPIIPPIPGIKRKKVLTAADFLANQASIGDRIVILGGGIVGCEAAAILAEMRKRVTIVEIMDGLARDMMVLQGRDVLLDLLADKGVTMLTQTRCEEISDQGVVIADAWGGSRTIEADSILLACGSVPESTIFQKLNGNAYAIYAAGDCVKPQTILEAIEDGAGIARAI